MEIVHAQTTTTENVQKPLSQITQQQVQQDQEVQNNDSENKIQEEQQKQVQKLIQNLDIAEKHQNVTEANNQSQTIQNQNQVNETSQQRSQEQEQKGKIGKERLKEMHLQEEHLKQDTSQNTFDYINISKENIQFGKFVLYPGSIQEVDLTIDLKSQLAQISQASNNPFMLRVIAKCSNEEFNELDEYVFSVRSNQRYQYFEQVRFKIKAMERAQVKVAVKIPPVKKNYIISGVLEVQLENLKPFCLPIRSNCQVPSVICLKNLYKTDQNQFMIKVPGKKNQVRMPPIPFKNLANFNFTMEVQAISSQNFAKRPYDIVVQNFVNCQANTQFFVNIQLKQNMSYQGPMPTRDTIRKILIFKIKNSTVYFNFPLQVHVFQSSMAGGIS